MFERHEIYECLFKIVPTLANIVGQIIVPDSGMYNPERAANIEYTL
jgi:hypothetical protein